MKKLYLLLIYLILFSVNNTILIGQSLDDYRSASTGNWNSASTWERYNGSSWEASTTTPTSANGVITIRNGHVVTITATVTYDQVIVESGGQINIDNNVTHTLNNGSGVDLSISGTWINQGSTWTMSSTPTWEVNSGGIFIHNTTSGISTPLNRANLSASSYFIYRSSGTAVSISGRTYGNLAFESSSGNWSPSPTGSVALTINGNFSIGTSGDGTVTLSTTGYTGAITVGGALSIGSGSSYTLGASQLTYGSLTNNGTFNLTLDNASGLTLSQALVLNGTLTLTSGLLTLGDYNLTLGESATISGTPSSSNMVVATGSGQLRKTFTGTGSFTFPVGDTTGTDDYSPVTLNFTSGSFSSAYAGVNLKNEKNSNNSSTTDYLDRYWTVTQSGISDFSCDVSFTYVEADVHGTEANIYCGSYNGSSWTLLNVVNPSTNTLSGTVTSFSTFTGGEQGVLPAELHSFTSSTSANSVFLSWMTSGELNNSGFDIERKKTESKNWQKIGFVQGHGTTNTPQSYSYPDRFLSTGKYNYRLKQIDFNGNYHFYTLVSEVTIGVPKKFEVSQNFPNPFNPVTKINYELPNDSKVSIKVFDMLGREVGTLLDEFKTAGYHTVDFDGSTLSSGMYFYRIKTNEFEAIRKMLLIK